MTVSTRSLRDPSLPLGRRGDRGSLVGLHPLIPMGERAAHGGILGRECVGDSLSKKACPQARPPSATMQSNSAGATGQTLRRDWRRRTMSRSAGSALIWQRVTGALEGEYGCEVHAGPVAAFGFWVGGRRVGVGYLVSAPRPLRLFRRPSDRRGRGHHASWRAGCCEPRNFGPPVHAAFLSRTRSAQAYAPGSVLTSQ